MSKVRLVIGMIVFYAILHGLVALNHCELSRESKAGKIIENNIDIPEYNDINVPSKGK